MKITIVMGFFLPMPPAAGGATEKSWHRLAQEFAQRGHEVTVISRTWPGWPNEERKDGVRYLRLTGFDHTARLVQNLWRDFQWSRRVTRALPPADITIVNCIALPLWLGPRRGAAGKLVVMTGRMPKGQYRLYRSIDRVIAVSSVVEAAMLVENPRLAPQISIYGYPIDYTSLAAASRTPNSDVVTLGYVGRLHREKGLHLLADALSLLGQQTNLPRWRVVFCGPHTEAQGGSGDEYLAQIKQKLQASLPADSWQILPPIFDSTKLASLYRQLDVFCYPSLAERGETFGVAVAEAMAAGTVPVVSALGCFRDFVIPEENGEVFAHAEPNAAAQLADRLAHLIRDRECRQAMAQKAQATVRRYDFPVYADRLLTDFSALMQGPLTGT